MIQFFGWLKIRDFADLVEGTKFQIQFRAMTVGKSWGIALIRVSGEERG